MTQGIWRNDNTSDLPVVIPYIRPKQTAKKLYKVTKTKYRKKYDIRTGTYLDEYEVVRKVTDYRINKGAATNACKYAVRENETAERMNAARPNSYPYKYEVQVEICDLPDFQPATYCEKHGVQPMFNVPGLTIELTCVECI